jgi:gluconolactonase
MAVGPTEPCCLWYFFIAGSFELPHFGVLEGTGLEVLDPEFVQCLAAPERVQRVWSGARWSEGPVWFPAHRTLVWSDIPNNRMLRYDEVNDVVGVFREDSNYSNGNALDQQGRLLSCEHLTRRLTRTEHDGRITVLVDRWQGKRLNSPNDLIVRSDGSIWFTDPGYGILSDFEGARAESEIGACNVYRLDPISGALDAVAQDFVMPSGLAFSPDESFLYVSDTGASPGPGPNHIRRIPVSATGDSLQQMDHDESVFAICQNGLFDGFRIDEDGRLWCSAADGVHVYNRNGCLIGKVRIPERVANVCFGGAKRNRLFICATSSLYSLYVKVKGL